MSDEEKTSIWKKELSFRRKPERDSADEEVDGTSIWKKEIGLRKKPDEPAAEPEPFVVEALEVAPEPVADPEPVPREVAALPHGRDFGRRTLCRSTPGRSDGERASRLAGDDGSQGRAQYCRDRRYDFGERRRRPGRRRRQRGDCNRRGQARKTLTGPVGQRPCGPRLYQGLRRQGQRGRNPACQPSDARRLSDPSAARSSL